MNMPRMLPSVVFSALLLMQSLFLFAQDSDWDHLMDAGEAAANQKQFAQAETSYRQAVSYAESHWKKDARISASLIKLAEVCNTEGKKEEAENATNRAVASLEVALKAHKPRVASDEYQQAESAAVLLTRAGDLFAANEKFADAEALYQRVISLRENYATEKRPAKPNNEDFFRFMAQNLGNAKAKVADAEDKLGSLYLRQHRFDQAQQQFERSLAIREKEFGPDKPPVAQSLSEIAMCHALQGKYDLAEPIYKRVVAILEQSKLADSTEMAIALEDYSLVLRRTGHEAEAAPVTEKAREIRAHLSGASGTTH